MKAKKAAVLARVSTNDQTTKRQTEELILLAKSQGYQVDKDDIFEDKISGFSKFETRPSLSKLINSMKSGKKQYDMIFCHEISRLSRSPEEGQKILTIFFDLGVPLYVKNINMCSMNEDGTRNPMFNIVFVLFSEFAASEAEYIKTRSKSGMLSKVREGHAGAGIMRPYGFTKHPKTKQLMIDEEEAEVVKDIFSMSLKGYGIRSIAKILNERGILTRSQKGIKKGFLKMKNSKFTKELTDMRWCEGTLDGILKNTIYKGERKYAGEVFEVPAIIDEMTFDEVQTKRTSNFTTNARDFRYLYILKNMVKCSCCGRNYVGRYNASSSDVYYHCSSGRMGESCDNRGISIEALESSVWSFIRYSSECMSFISSNGNVRDIGSKLDGLKQELYFKEKEAKAIETEKDRVMMLFRKKMLTESKLDSDIKKLNKEYDVLMEQIVGAKKQIYSLGKFEKEMKNHRTILSKIESFGKDRYMIAEIIQNLVERVQVQCVKSKQHNNNSYIVTIIFKNVTKTRTILITTNQRNHNANFKFISQEEYAKAGQNRFRMVESNWSPLIYEEESDATDFVLYDERNRLKTSISKIMASFGNDGYVPELVEFETSKNQIENVNKLKKIRKAA